VPERVRLAAHHVDGDARWREHLRRHLVEVPVGIVEDVRERATVLVAGRRGELVEAVERRVDREMDAGAVRECTVRMSIGS
jgi:hypothetical protein